VSVHRRRNGVDVVEVRQASRYDVALAKLATPITDIAPLPVSTSTPKTGTILRMTGWGATSSVDPTPTTRLQTGQFEITRVAGTDVKVVGYAPAPDTSACLYDSGAPYFTEGSQSVPCPMDDTNVPYNSLDRPQNCGAFNADAKCSRFEAAQSGRDAWWGTVLPIGTVRPRQRAGM
jgi:hypothetical protein